MSERNFFNLLQARWNEGKVVCVGLDTDVVRIPKSVSGGSLRERIVNFNQQIVDATHDIVCAYKPNSAFYEALGPAGLMALHDTVQRIHRTAPGVPIIDDAKRGDIGNTNNGYVQSIFEHYKFDAVTINPYLGAEEGIQPFLDQKNKGIIVLVRTSNKGATEFQDRKTAVQEDELTKLLGNEVKVKTMPIEHGWLRVTSDDLKNRFWLAPAYQYVALRVAHAWNKNGNCVIVAGATYPSELEGIRHIIGGMPILIPGIGAQGGELEATVKAGVNSKKQGMIINSSRGIIFASSGSDYAEAARRETLKLHGAITQVLATI